MSRLTSSTLPLVGRAAPTSSPALLAGVVDPRRIERGVCAAGHKALYSAAWGGLPSKEFLARLDPKLAALRERLYDEAHTLDRAGGTACTEWASRLRPARGHPGRRRRVRRAPRRGRRRARAGHAGQDHRHEHLRHAGRRRRTASARRHPRPLRHRARLDPARATTASRPANRRWATSSTGSSKYIQPGGDATAARMRPDGRGRAKLKPGESGLLALDWNNGNRTILVDQRLTGLLLGQTLHTTPAEIYRALIEATAFGALTIINRFEEYGVKIERGRQLRRHRREEPAGHADLRRRARPADERSAGSAQTPALGSAIAAARHCRRSRGRSRQLRDGAGDHDAARRAPPSTRTQGRRAPTTRSTRSTASSTTASAASRERKPTCRR